MIVLVTLAFLSHDCKVTPFPIPISQSSSPLRSWLLFLLLPQRRQTNTRDLDDLESNTRNISLRLSLTTETCEEDFIVLVYEVETTIVRYESCDLLSVLDQLDSDALPNGRVRLLGFDSDLLENYALGVRGTSER